MENGKFWRCQSCGREYDPWTGECVVVPSFPPDCQCLSWRGLGVDEMRKKAALCAVREAELEDERSRRKRVEERLNEVLRGQRIETALMDISALMRQLDRLIQGDSDQRYQFLAAAGEIEKLVGLFPEVRFKILKQMEPK